MPPKTHLRSNWNDPGDWERRSNSVLFSPSTKSIVNMSSAYCSSRTPCPNDMPYRVGTASMTLCEIYNCKPFPVVTMTLSAAYYDAALFGSEILQHVYYLLRSPEEIDGTVLRAGGGMVSGLTKTCYSP